MIEPIGNRKVKAKKEAFCKFIEENKEKAFYVCCHDNPDPDALASAMGVAHILRFLNVESVNMFYCGEISHPQNRAMNNILNIPAQIWHGEVDNRENCVYIFVDCVGNQKNMSIQVKPDIVIDHHKALPAKGVLAIHDEIGSCSTLVLDLMLSIPPHVNEENDMKSLCFDPEGEDNEALSTALAIGIKTDTVDFRSETTTDDDFKAYKLLSRHLSNDKFHKIVNYQLPPYMFDAEEIAWKNRSQDTPNLITGLGFLEESRGDCIPYLADKMMRLEGIQTVVVYAIVGTSVRASIRTVSATKDAKYLVNELFGEGNGGAKQGIGGATVNFNLFDPHRMTEEDRLMFWELTKRCIEGKFKDITLK